MKRKNISTSRETDSTKIISTPSDQNLQQPSPLWRSPSFWYKVFIFFMIIGLILTLFGVVMPFYRQRQQNKIDEENSVDLLEDAEESPDTCALSPCVTDTSSYCRIKEKICMPGIGENGNDLNFMDYVPMTRGLRPSAHTTATRACAKFYHIQRTKGYWYSQMSRARTIRKACEKDEKTINNFMKENKEQIMNAIDGARDKARLAAKILDKEMRAELWKYKFIPSSDDIKIIKTRTDMTKLITIMQVMYDENVFFCGDHASVAAGRALAKQIQGLLPHQEILHFSFMGTKALHEIVLFLKKNLNMSKQEIENKIQEGAIYGFENIKNFIMQYAEDYCDSWNDFDMGGYQPIERMFQTRLYGFGKDPVEHPEAYVMRVRRLDDVDFSKRPKEMKAFDDYAQRKYDELVKELIKQSNRYDNHTEVKHPIFNSDEERERISLENYRSLQK